MSLRARVFGALSALLALTVLGAWLIVAGAVLRPMTRALLEERADLAVFIADRAAEAPDPDAEARRLASALGLEARVLPERPARLSGRPLSLTLPRGARAVEVWRARRTPMALSLRPDQASPVVVLWFPVDLNLPRRRTGLGLLTLGLAAIGGAALATRWMLRPLDLAVTGMSRMAAGDLAHRLPTGSDASGRIGAAFNAMAERLGSLLQGQRRLMAGVSHELRTPLARARLEAELLADEGANGARIRSINDEIDEMDGLVDELLESARLEQGVLALALEPVDLADLAAELLGAVDLGERPVVLAVPPGLVARLDRRRALRALKNLLSNAVRYTPSDAEITLSATVDGDALTLSVADRGGGVDREDLDRLFEPFFRADHSRSRATGGLGLGLMLVRQIAEAHGGNATAAEREGGGLIVAIRVPGAVIS